MTTSNSEGRVPYRTTRPEKQGLYDPAYEHDACGVGFVVDIKGRKSHKILQQGLQVLTNLDRMINSIQTTSEPTDLEGQADAS